MGHFREGGPRGWHSESPLGEENIVPELRFLKLLWRHFHRLGVFE